MVRGTDEQLPLAAPDLDTLRAEAKTCTACPLYAHATQTVFGDGRVDAPLVLVGEQPGDQEDLEGVPFVGPAGRLLRRMLTELDAPMGAIYVTNAVKHFKFTQRGKRRLHKKPTRSEVLACRPWLTGELAAIQPQIVVALGVTAATSLLGRTVVLRNVRGKLLPWDGPGHLLVTAHPSSVLRAEPGQERDEAHAELVADLRATLEAIGS